MLDRRRRVCRSSFSVGKRRGPVGEREKEIDISSLFSFFVFFTLSLSLSLFWLLRVAGVEGRSSDDAQYSRRRRFFFFSGLSIIPPPPPARRRYQTHTHTPTQNQNGVVSFPRRLYADQTFICSVLFFCDRKDSVGSSENPLGSLTWPSRILPVLFGNTLETFDPELCVLRI